jgi:hypothetical protein
MFRDLIINPVLLAVGAAVGVGVCRAVGVNPHIPEMIAALGSSVVAGELALIPAVLARGKSNVHVAQAAFLGMVLHLLTSVALAALVILVMRPPQSFAFWMLAGYWITLVGVSVVLIKAVRRAKPMPAAQ